MPKAMRAKLAKLPYGRSAYGVWDAKFTRYVDSDCKSLGLAIARARALDKEKGNPGEQRFFATEAQAGISQMIFRFYDNQGNVISRPTQPVKVEEQAEVEMPEQEQEAVTASMKSAMMKRRVAKKTELAKKKAALDKAREDEEPKMHFNSSLLKQADDEPTERAVPKGMVHVKSSENHDEYVFFFDIGHDSGGPKQEIVGEGPLTEGDRLLKEADKTWDEFLKRSTGTEIHPWWYGGYMCAYPINGGQALQTDDGGLWYGDEGNNVTADDVRQFIEDTDENDVVFSEEMFETARDDQGDFDEDEEEEENEEEF
jgi:hypothetical protein